MKILIPGYAVEAIARGVCIYPNTNPNKPDIKTADFLLSVYHRGGQLLTLKQAFRIYHRLKYLHHHPNLANPKIQKSILLNGGTFFYCFLTRSLYSEN